MLCYQQKFIMLIDDRDKRKEGRKSTLQSEEMKRKEKRRIREEKDVHIMGGSGKP